MQQRKHEEVKALSVDVVNVMRGYRKTLIDIYGLEVGWEMFIRTFYLACMDPDVIKAEASAFRMYLEETEKE